MAKTKKYKSVSSYLRAHGQGLNYNLPRRGRDHEQQRAAAKVEQRNILNNLLPQLGLPMLDSELLEGIEQLLVMGGWTDVQANALRDCQKWLKNFRIVTITSSAPVEPVKTAQGLVSYLVHGFSRADHNVRISMIVDAAKYGRGAFEIAEQIAGPDYCCHASSNIDHLVPDSAKNKLFFSDEELYAAVPEMRPREVTRRRRRTVVRKPEATAQPVEPVRRKKPPLSPADWRR